MKKLDRTILGAQGSTLGAAIRNAMDPEDPAHHEFAAMIPERLEACFRQAIEAEIPLEEAAELILGGVQGQVGFLKSGFLTELRKEVKEQNE